MSLFTANLTLKPIRSRHTDTDQSQKAKHIFGVVIAVAAAIAYSNIKMQENLSWIHSKKLRDDLDVAIA